MLMQKILYTVHPVQKLSQIIFKMISYIRKQIPSTASCRNSRQELLLRRQVFLKQKTFQSTYENNLCGEHIQLQWYQKYIVPDAFFREFSKMLRDIFLRLSLYTNFASCVKV